MLRVSTTLGIPHNFDLILEGEKHPCHSVWRTETNLVLSLSGRPRPDRAPINTREITQRHTAAVNSATRDEVMQDLEAAMQS